MVQIEKENNNIVFWQAAVISIVVFLLGLFVGVMFESQRTEATMLTISSLTYEFSNIKQMTFYYQQISNKDYCEEAIKQNFKFTNNNLKKGQEIERYENANILIKTMDSKKREYLLLKTEFLINTLILKEKCNMSQNMIFYFYSDKTTNKNIIAQQAVQSKVLTDLHNKQTDTFILIPLAADLNNTVVDLLLASHNITQMPSLLINNKIVLSGIQSESEIERYLQKKNSFS